MDVDATPLKMTYHVSKKRDLNPVSMTSPLVPQLVSISRQIKDTPVPDDLSDQFPSLVGQEMFTPLCTTLARYGGGTKQELDIDIDILSSSSTDASATAVDTEDDFLVTNDDTNPDNIQAVQNDVSLVDEKEGKSIDMEALNNGVVETDVIMEVPTLVEIVSVQPLPVDVTEEPKIIIEELTEQSEVNEPKEDTLKDVDCEPEKQITQAAEAQPYPRQIVQVPPEASVESNTEATGENKVNLLLCHSQLG